MVFGRFRDGVSPERAVVVYRTEETTAEYAQRKTHTHCSPKQKVTRSRANTERRPVNAAEFAGNDVVFVVEEFGCLVCFSFAKLFLAIELLN